MSKVRAWGGLLALVAALTVPANALATEVFVSDDAGERVLPYSIDANGSLTPIACTATNCATGDSPEGTAVSPDGRFLYVADSSADAVSPFAIGANGSLTPIACTAANCGTGHYPIALAVSPNGKFLYTAGIAMSSFSINANGSLTPIACAAATCNTGTWSNGAAVSTDGKFLYTTNQSANTVSPFAISSDGSLTPLTCSGTNCQTGQYPDGVVVSPNGKYLYTVNQTSSTFSPFSINANGTLTPIACPGTSCDTGRYPIGLAISPDGQHLYTTNGGADTVSPFSINTDGTLTSISCTAPNCNTGDQPEGVAVSPDSQFLYAASINNNNPNPAPNPLSPFSIGGTGALTPIACPGTTCDTNGQPAVQAVAISPDQAPTAAFDSTPAAPGQATKFDGSDSTASPGQDVARYDWDFGDGHSAPNGGAKPSHTYAAAGSYTVVLTVTDDAGCSTASTQTFTGQTVSCNGGAAARKSKSIQIGSSSALDTKISTAKINANKGKAKFEFKAIGTATGFECELAKKHKTPEFKGCESPKAYRHLKPGHYTFEVRALNAGVKDPKPAEKAFKIN